MLLLCMLTAADQLVREEIISESESFPLYGDDDDTAIIKIHGCKIIPLKSCMGVNTRFKKKTAKERNC